MIYGVFSDVHSNLEALTVVLEFFKKSHVDGYLCCGDLVGYGADPNACLDRIRTLKGLSIICGNHDLAAIGRMELGWFNQYARAAIIWTREVLTPGHRSFLESLKTSIETKELTLTHGSARNPAEEYLLSSEQFRDNVPLVHSWPLFVGHSHLPLVFRYADAEGVKVDVRFLEDHQVISVRTSTGVLGPIALNPGSVGQPRDQDRRASCAIYDSAKGTFCAFRLPYDVSGAQKKIRAAGLPEYLALRLDCGQ